MQRLSSEGRDRETGIAALHALLLRAARFEVQRRGVRPGPGDGDDLAHQSADDALVAILNKLADFRGDSRFATWAYKFALHELPRLPRGSPHPARIRRQSQPE